MCLGERRSAAHAGLISSEMLARCGVATPDTLLTTKTATAEIVGAMDVSSLPRALVDVLEDLLHRLVDREDPTFTSREAHERYRAEARDLLRMLDARIERR